MKQIFIIIIGILSLCANVLYAENRIVITQGVNTPRPIVVVPFKWKGTGRLAPENIGKIIADDLRNSGKFNPINTMRMPQQPTTITEIIPDVWTALGINIVIFGYVQPSADGYYIVSYHMVDTSDHLIRILSHNQYKVTKQWLRYSAHSSSDEIFKTLTGIKGAFCTRIAYIVHKKNNKFPYELRISDYDGYHSFIIHRSQQPLMSPAWSPDGNKLAYVTFESGHSVLVMQTLSNGVIHILAAFPNHNGAPSFSPDGNKLAFALSKTGNLNIYIMNLNVGTIHQVTYDHSNNTEPAWFPDSKTLAFTSDQSGHPQVYKVNINSNYLERLTWDSSRNQDSDISYNGKFMVVVSTDNYAQHIAKLDIKSNTYQILTDTLLDENPSIAPNGTMIIYSSSQGLGSILRLVSTDGRFTTDIPTTDSNVKFPAWSPYL
ncbi:Protein TolB [Candidatus Profftia lariciata]|uniref:Tol-Pal system beta propeller repeat protein TolB n=1 Tax=Candidatus Profftia lariciata TaxID=1987921 RepID=UPI001D02BB56|nr:Tol-Pal system beta propeller repeat protein TolB [Candidatus Profftia lariciata]UDG81506.1 Protein TolB [Candidatus Profftia lariciata]